MTCFFFKRLARNLRQVASASLRVAKLSQHLRRHIERFGLGTTLKFMHRHIPSGDASPAGTALNEKQIQPR